MTESLKHSAKFAHLKYQVIIHPLLITLLSYCLTSVNKRIKKNILKNTKIKLIFILSVFGFM